MSEEIKLDGLEHKTDVIKTSLADPKGVYSKGDGTYVQFEGEGVVEGPARTESKEAPKVGIYAEPGKDVTEIALPVAAVFRSPNQKQEKPADALRDLPLPKAAPGNEPGHG